MKKISSLFIISLFVITGCSKLNIVSEVNDFEACVAAGNPVMESYPEQCIYEEKIFVNDVTDQVDEMSSVYIVSIDGSVSWEENYSEDLIGCDDKLLEVVVGENLSPEEALEKLIYLKEIDFKSGEYNAFLLSDKLEIISFDIENGIAIVKFSDKLMTGGTCDAPRITAQIRETLLPYPEIDEVEVYVGEESIENFLSEKD
ncbi:MAG: GerMN domain-containing protein [Candidatus Moraniibacteriota bacterium]|jgi:sporulation and spore germination protein